MDFKKVLLSAVSGMVLLSSLCLREGGASSVLQPASPPAEVRVENLSFEEKGDGVVLTLFLNHAPDDLKVRDTLDQPIMTLTFSGKMDARIKMDARMQHGLQRFRGHNLQQVYWEHIPPRRTPLKSSFGTVLPNTNRIQLFLRRAVGGTSSVSVRYPKTELINEASVGESADSIEGSTEGSPRVVIHIRDYNLSNRNINTTEDNPEGVLSPQAHIAEGIIHRRLTWTGVGGPVQVNVLEVDLQNPRVEVFPALASDKTPSETKPGSRQGMTGLDKVENMVRRNGGIAGINASFFKPDSQIPLGLLMIHGELITGPIFQRASLGIGENNRVQMARVKLQGEMTLLNGHRIPLNTINQPRVARDQVVLYSSLWGRVAPKVPEGGIQAQLLDNHLIGLSQKDPMSIPEEGFVVSGPRAKLAPLLSQWEKQSARQQSIALRLFTTPDWSRMTHALSGGPILLQEGRLALNPEAESFHFAYQDRFAPRSAVGLTAQGKLILVAADGYQQQSTGMTLQELAVMMRELGARQAMNLDGGGSTQMVVKGKIVNTPSDAGGRSVSTCLVVRSKNTPLQNAHISPDPSQSLAHAAP